MNYIATCTMVYNIPIDSITFRSYHHHKHKVDIIYQNKRIGRRAEGEKKRDRRSEGARGRYGERGDMESERRGSDGKGR